MRRKPKNGKQKGTHTRTKPKDESEKNMYLAPTDTLTLLHEGKHLDEPNPYLLFRKYIGQWQWETQDGVAKLRLGSRKHRVLKEITERRFGPSAEALLSCHQRFNSLQKNYEENGINFCLADLETHWRLAVGLGAKGSLEVGLTLHHLYGFPYIPASSLKGLARAYAFLVDCGIDVNIHFLENFVEQPESLKLLDEGKDHELKQKLSYKKEKTSPPIYPSDGDLQKIRDRKGKLELIQKVFGNQGQAGKVIFFDGLPTEFPKLEVDVINVHYQDYYSDKSRTTPPGDWMSPVPTFFLAVAPNQKFQFYLASREKTFLSETKNWLVGGLTQLGVGGKTSAGYGYFKQPPQASTEKLSQHRETETSPKETTPPKGATIAKVIDITTKPMKVQIFGGDEIVSCSGVNPQGLGLQPGSVVFVMLDRDKKTKKIISAKYTGKP